MLLSGFRLGGRNDDCKGTFDFKRHSVLDAESSKFNRFWMPPAYYMPGLPLGEPGKPVPGYGQGQTYQSLPRT